MEVVEKSELATFRPLGDRILVLPDLAKGVTDGGVVIPENLQERPPCGVVLQVGRGFGDTCPVNVGDKVRYHKLCGVELEFDGVVYLVMRLTDIIALL